MNEPCRRRAIWAKRAETEQSPQPAPFVEPKPPEPVKRKPGRPPKEK